MTSDTYLSLVRSAEIDAVRDFLDSECCVLELGGGSGYQAKLLSGIVDRVISIDPSPHTQQSFPVASYDGVNIPFDSSTFDRVFSSNVLEHIGDLQSILNEMKRVLKPDGLAIHILPSAPWRLWTTLSHYPALPKLIYLKFTGKNRAKTEIVEDGAQGHTFSIWDVLISQRHGERGNSLSEIFYFKSTWWQKTFEECGWEIVSAYPTGIFYSGNVLFGKLLPINIRKFLAKFLGSSTTVFVLKPSAKKQT